MFSAVKSNVQRGLNFVYAFFVAAILLTVIVCRVEYISPKYGNVDAVIHSVICIQQLLILVTIIAIYYETFCYPDRMETVLQLLDDIDRAFVQLNIKFDYRRFRWKIFIEIIGLSALIHITFVALCTYHQFRLFSDILYELFGRFYPMYLVNAMLLMFVNFCCLIKNKFTALKQLLRDFCDIIDAFGDSEIDDMHEIWKIKLMQTTPRTFFSELKQIASIYESLFIVVNHLNTIFGLSNLTSLALLGISLTCHLFLLVKILMEYSIKIDGLCFELFGEFFIIQMNFNHNSG